MYTYYQKIQKEEHMLYADEILEIFKAYLPVDTTPKKIHSIISKHCKEYNKEDPNLYYNTRGGLKKVYPQDLWYPALVKYTLVDNL